MADDIDAAASTDGTVTDAGASAPVAVSEAAASPAQPAGTLLGTEPADKAVAAPATWPEDWRKQIAGDDAKELARLQRMGSPADLFKSYRALESKLAEKGTGSKLPDNATPEQVAAWRKENGIPEAPEGYEQALPDGLVLGEADKPLVTEFQKVALDANMTAAQFNKALGWYYQQQDALRIQQEEADVERRKGVEDGLRAEWGGEYRANLNAVNNTMTMAFGDAARDILSARLPDGSLLGDNPVFIKGMALTAREISPAMPHIPAGSGNPLQATENRIAEIEALMRAPNAHEAYWKNEKVQNEYRDLLDARERYASRKVA